LIINKLALWGLVLSLLPLGVLVSQFVLAILNFTLELYIIFVVYAVSFLVSALFGLLIGISSMYRIRKSKGQLDGKDFAIFSIIFGIISMGIIIYYSIIIFLYGFS
jgi:hypothetical protein